MFLLDLFHVKVVVDVRLVHGVLEDQAELHQEMVSRTVQGALGLAVVGEAARLPPAGLGDLGVGEELAQGVHGVGVGGRGGSRGAADGLLIDDDQLLEAVERGRAVDRRHRRGAGL